MHDKNINTITLFTENPENCFMAIEKVIYPLMVFYKWARVASRQNGFSNGHIMRPFSFSLKFTYDYLYLALLTMKIGNAAKYPQ